MSEYDRRNHHRVKWHWRGIVNQTKAALSRRDLSAVRRQQLERRLSHAQRRFDAAMTAIKLVNS